jgi:hypothetical protein
LRGARSKFSQSSYLHESAMMASRMIFGTLSRATSSVKDGRWYIEWNWSWM